MYSSMDLLKNSSHLATRAEFDLTGGWFVNGKMRHGKELRCHLEGA